MEKPSGGWANNGKPSREGADLSHPDDGRALPWRTVGGFQGVGVLYRRGTPPKRTDKRKFVTRRYTSLLLVASHFLPLDRGDNATNDQKSRELVGVDRRLGLSIGNSKGFLTSSRTARSTACRGNHPVKLAYASIWPSNNTEACIAILDEGTGETFDTERLLTAVDAVDQLRYALGDQEAEPGFVPRPPELRENLMKLHELVFNEGFQVSREDLCKAAMLLEDIEADLYEIRQNAEQAEEVLRDLSRALPEISEEDYDSAYE